MSVVACKLPKSGLGNQLFPLMKAYVYAALHQLPVIVTGYHRFKPGPYLRREKIKRNYNNYFTFQKGLIGEQLDKWKLAIMSRECVKEPLLDINAPPAGKAILFTSIPHWDNCFDGLQDHRPLVIKLFWQLVREDIRKKLNQQQPPVIGVHVRKGDFRKLAAGEDFSKVGLVQTPEQYFIGVIQGIRKIHGSDLPVTVFTDGYRHEFESLFSLINISMAEGNPDIVDLLLLSRSRIIITSAGSTFSYWAGFLSNAPLILHPHHIHKPIRQANNEASLYEGAFNTQDNYLIELIRSI